MANEAVMWVVFAVLSATRLQAAEQEQQLFETLRGLGR